MSSFDSDQFGERLEASGLAIVETLRSIRTELAQIEPAPGKWSVVEIVAHLVDEEREDFRARVRSTLEDNRRPWPPIDPEGWVSERSYAAKPFAATVDEFERERAASIGWLVSLVDVDWTMAYEHPKFGALRAGDLLASWVAHDLLHLAQLRRTQAQLLETESAPFSTHYAMP